MRRDLGRLQRHASFVAADLGRTLDGAWSCNVTDDYVLRVTGPTWQGVVEIDADVDEDNLSEAEAYPGYPEETLDDDASEAVAEHVVELLGNARVDWPMCPTHGTQLGTCSGVWTCPAGAHDPAAVGRLGAS